MSKYVSIEDIENAMDEVLDGAKKNKSTFHDRAVMFNAMYDMMKLIMEVSVDVKEDIHAHWQLSSPFTDTEECSNCHGEILGEELETEFCPYCGAKMEPYKDGDENDQ